MIKRSVIIALLIFSVLFAQINEREKRYLESAKLALSRGSVSSARIYYKNILVVNPNSVDALEGIAKTSFTNSEIVETEKFFVNFFASNNLSGREFITMEDLKFLKAKLSFSGFYMLTGREQGAERIIEEFLSLKSEELDLNRILIEFYIGFEMFDRAVEEISRVRKTKNDETLYCADMFEIFVGLLEVENAAKEVVKICIKEEIEQKILVSKILTFIEGITEEEASSFIKIIRDASDNNDSMYYSGVLSSIYYGVGDYETSFSFLEKSDVSKEAILIMADKLRMDNNFYEAEKFYKEFFNKFSDNIDVSYNYGLCLFKLKKYSELEELFSKYNSELLNQLKMEYYLKVSEFDKALILFDDIEKDKRFSITPVMKLNKLKILFYKNENITRIKKGLSNLMSESLIRNNRDLYSQVVYLLVLSDVFYKNNFNLEELKAKLKTNGSGSNLDFRIIEFMDIFKKELLTQKSFIAKKIMLSVVIPIDISKDELNGVTDKEELVDVLRFNYYIDTDKSDDLDNLIGELEGKLSKSCETDIYENLIYRIIDYLLKNKGREDKIDYLSELFYKNFPESIYLGNLKQRIRNIN
ncbi:MAG: hypothetical protein JXR48_06730 [Candidatus Delongbacteria bacterium]|nr:hypothetical protein [Candidatus Delongbacteria bacterium]MBN2834646.1 hypothetical protein [Candidatus Delongbacteria bacterium]